MVLQCKMRPSIARANGQFDRRLQLTNTTAPISHTRPSPVSIHHPITAYYSFINLERMKGWVGLVGWPVADGLPKWSLVSCRPSAGQGKFASQRPMFYCCATQPTILLVQRLVHHQGQPEFICRLFMLPDHSCRCGCESAFIAAVLLDSALESSIVRSHHMACARMSSVANGVDHFKHGRLTEAMQMFNKALQIDDDNVEALVARGALYVCSPCCCSVV